MFEKEAEDKAFEKHPIPQVWNEIHLAKNIAYAEGFQDGAEFGYNKANEWHYVKDGDLPKEPKRYLCKIECYVGSAITYECSDYDVEYNSWKDSHGDVIAWKEIVLPELKEK